MERRVRLTMVFVLAIVALILLAAGCSSDKSTGPVASRSGGAASSFVADDSPRPALFLHGTGRSGSQDGDAQGDLGSFFSSLVVDGTVGGQLAHGRVTLTIPPGAFQGVQTITLADTTASDLECQLFPEGLQFDVPVTLEVRLDGTAADASSATVYWYNPTTTQWVDISGQYDIASHSVRAALHHFSDYRVGRCGW